MTNRELVCHGHVWRQRALRRHAGPIHEVGADLADTVEMNSCGLIPQMVGELHDDGVAHGGLDLWAWPLAIYANDWPHKTVRGSIHPSSCPVVRHRGSIGKCWQEQSCQGGDMSHHGRVG